jgi:hypothetical protein
MRPYLVTPADRYTNNNNNNNNGSNETGCPKKNGHNSKLIIIKISKATGVRVSSYDRETLSV